MDTEFANIRQKVKRELADYLGIDMEDIEDESDFSVDFHMSPTDMTDFMDILNKSGLDTEGLDLSTMESFSDLVEALTAHV